MSPTLQSEKKGRIKTLYCLLFVLLSGLVLPPESWSQQSHALSASLGGLEIRATPELETILRIQNRDILKLRATVGGFSPEQRARNIADRFSQVVGRKTTASLISRREFPPGVAFYLDDQFIFAIAPQDLDTPSGETIEQAADRAEGQLHVAIKESFEARNIRGLLGSLLLASLATAAFFAFVFAVQRIRVRTCRTLERRESTAHFLSRLLGTTFRIALNVAVLVIELVAANLWITFVLQKFPYTRPWGETISKKILAVLFKISIAVTNALPDVLIVAMIFLACYFSSRSNRGT
jgi:hypothetical protein